MNTGSEWEFCGRREWFDAAANGTDWFDVDPTLSCSWQTFATAGPATYLTLAIGLRVWYVSSILPRMKALQASRLFIIKQLLNLLCFVALVAEVIDASWHGQYQYQILSPAIMAYGMLLSYITLEMEHNRGFRLSKVLIVYWALSFVVGTVRLYAMVERFNVGIDGRLELRLGMFILYYTTLAFSTGLVFVKEPPFVFEGLKPCPESSSNLFSLLSFSWLNGLMRLGYSRPLVDEDLYGLNAEDQAPELAAKFKASWAIEAKRRSPSLMRAFSRAFGPTMYIAAFFKLAQDLLAFVQPQLLKGFIDYIESRNKPDDADKDPQEIGWELACGMFGIALLQSICLHQYFHRVYKTGMRVRSGVMTAVYDKSLRLSNASRQSSTSGEIVNLMAIDAQRFMDVCNYIHMLWSAPVQIALSLYFLYQEMQSAIFAGFGVMLLLIPVNTWIAGKERAISRKLMTKKDSRIKQMNELLNGVKVMKLYAWERAFLEQVTGSRGAELAFLRKAAIWRACSTFSWTIAPFLVSIATFAIYTMDGSLLTPQKAFVALALFNLLRFPLAMLPMVITSAVQAQVSIARLKKFLLLEETNPDNVIRSPPPHGGPARKDRPLVSIDQGMFAWKLDGFNTVPVLKNINLKVYPETIAAVVGPVGCGKSSLMSATLGQMEKMQGDVRMAGTVAYVPQEAWIQNATLRENILFSLPCEPERYQEVLEACALSRDLAILPAGDMTEIGEKGINLSGGQKQRVSLARAVYAKAHVYILDDPLSAVDTHVGKHIFDKVIGPNGLLKDASRIFVTNSVQYLPQCDHVVCMEDGEIREQGRYEELVASGGAFTAFIEEHGTEVDVKEEEIEIPEVASLFKPTFDFGGSSKAVPTKTSPFKSDNGPGKLSEKTPLIGERLVKVETTRKGKVLWDIYKKYVRALGVCTTAALIGMYALAYTANVGTNYWLKTWSDCSSNEEDTAGICRTEIEVFIAVYGALGCGYSILVFCAAIALAFGGIAASERFHRNMLAQIVRAPMSFFDTTPIGRIVNRFSQDIYTVDEMIPRTLASFISCAMQVVSTVVVITLSSSVFLVAVVPLAVMFWLIQRYYVQTSRQLKRLESVSRSPIYAHFGETLAGAASITAYEKSVLFVSENENKVDYNLQAYYPSVSANRWLAMRLEFLGNCIIFFAAVFAVIEDDGIDPSMVGLSLTYAMSVTQTLNWMVRMATELETNIVAVERIDEFAQVNTEKPAILPYRPPFSWPRTGVIEFSNYSVRYREGLDLALRDISFKVEDGEKIGIVGRTGAGKSSLTLSILRLLEPAGGKIEIDGEDITMMGLEDLRSKLTIMPQDAVLYAGSVRSNIDPFLAYDDDTLWKALEISHLKAAISALKDGLSSEVSEGGSNFSAGQRQLLCLTRAVLRKTKILILDEATAACDLDTDDLIQKTIRNVFADTTVLTIAHRINTIMDSDRIMVLDEGKIAEFDSPANLIANPESIFRGMAISAGLVSESGEAKTGRVARDLNTADSSDV
jgi:ABC-type multidrug transport system fused ATPase/permease subunit